MKHIPKENIKVSLSVGFLASLQDRHNERYSKHEAFCYLLDKACEHYMPKAVSKKVADELKDFQFITTKTLDYKMTVKNQATEHNLHRY